MYQSNPIERFAESIANNFNWTNTFGLGRSVLAMASILTLLLNDPGMLITPLGELVIRDANIFVAKISIFYLLSDYLLLAKWIALFILFLTVSGWRPRITGILHWWVAYSIAASCMVIDGGDQIAGVLTLILIPFCLADSRKWHWTFVEGKTASKLQKHLNILAAVSFLLIRLQVAYIYFHASIGKMAVEEWMNGTAVYYWSQSPLFEMPTWLAPILNPIFQNPLAITAVTWGTMAFELLLFMGLVINHKWRPLLLKAGILFHFTIILLYGLVSFFFSMTGCLLLFLGPRNGFDFIRAIGEKWKTLTANKSLLNNSSELLAPEIVVSNNVAEH